MSRRRSRSSGRVGRWPVPPFQGLGGEGRVSPGRCHGLSDCGLSGLQSGARRSVLDLLFPVLRPLSSILYPPSSTLPALPCFLCSLRHLRCLCVRLLRRDVGEGDAATLNPLFSLLRLCVLCAFVVRFPPDPHLRPSAFAQASADRSAESADPLLRFVACPLGLPPYRAKTPGVFALCGFHHCCRWLQRGKFRGVWATGPPGLPPRQRGGTHTEPRSVLFSLSADGGIFGRRAGAGGGRGGGLEDLHLRRFPPARARSRLRK